MIASLNGLPIIDGLARFLLRVFAKGCGRPWLSGAVCGQINIFVAVCPHLFVRDLWLFVCGLCAICVVCGAICGRLWIMVKR